jgi:hypothetical protein
MSATRPAGTRTGLVTAGCYAAPLRDCDGKGLTKEHYISEALLKLFGKTFIADGFAWQTGPRSLSPGALTAKVLCERHNSALSPLDTAIRNLYSALDRADTGQQAGDRLLDGEDVERWAVKVLLGLTTSGNVLGANGKPERLETVPEQWLRYLFGDEAAPQGCGFYYVGDGIDGFDADLLDVAVNRWPPGDPQEGFVFGVTIKLGRFQFVTAPFAKLEVEKQRLIHRPAEFKIGEPECLRVQLRWEPPSTRVLILR